jgi:hypothetical protein
MKDKRVKHEDEEHEITEFERLNKDTIMNE